MIMRLFYTKCFSVLIGCLLFLIIIVPSNAANIRVLTLNVMVHNNTHNGTLNFDGRLPGIKKLIENIDPDVIGVQEIEIDEGDTWNKLKIEFPEYYAYARARHGIITSNSDEGVGFLWKKSRFSDYLYTESRDVSYHEKPKRNRNILRVVIHDNIDNIMIDMYNLHAPTINNRKKGYIDRLFNWINGGSYDPHSTYKKGDPNVYPPNKNNNTIILGDFNNGIEATGEYDIYHKYFLDGLNDYQFPIYSVYKKVNTTNSEDDFRTAWNIEDYDLDTWQGKMIDHIYASNSFYTMRSTIDRNIFYNGELVNCDDNHSRSEIDAQGYGYLYCFPDPTNLNDSLPLHDFDGSIAISDHWAVWADINVTPFIVPAIMTPLLLN